MRVALYARYSSELQSEASIEDQLFKLKERTCSQDWGLSGTYSDAAKSGASMMRPGLQALLQDAATSKFDILLCEALDRLSRNQADIARIYEQLSFHGIKLITLSEGTISELHIGLKGTMNALFLKDLADKTRRGLEGRVRAGKSGGGKAYGYRVPVRLDHNGQKRAGELIINTDEASVINRIFEMYAVGVSPRAISHTLNKEDVKGPNGKPWGPSTINGNRRRGTGIINNELYIGRRIWNRLSYRKDPASGKRVSRLNRAEDWIIREIPQLRIVADDLWQAVRERQSSINERSADNSAPAFYTKQRPKYFWSGKVKCGQCGGSYTKINKDMLGCATSRNKGLSICANRKNIRIDVLEEHLLTSLKHHLMQPDLFAEFIDAFTEELNRLQGEARGERQHIEACITKIDNQLDKAVDAVLAGADALSLNTRMKTLEIEKAELTQKLSSISNEPPMLLHPNMSHIYKERVGSLTEALNANRQDPHAFEAIRILLSKVTLTPSKDGFVFDIEGDLAQILALCSTAEQKSAAGNKTSTGYSKTTKPSERKFGGSDELAQQVKLVAGVRFEPTTFRL
ncbi:recombinase family protein [Kordiimonas aquimaris]|uniref:recombinase family protein n=1 Tax=Kordiimonas aquimaris TaxID=707591 RepID=UPI0021D3C0F3|nr:recombinase family protein [Kordiimonas aquimaris]